MIFFCVCCADEEDFTCVGVFDSKPDLSSFQTGLPSGPGSGPRSGSGSEVPQVVAPPPNPKLGLAPLSSELHFSGSGRASSSGAGPSR